MKIFNEGAYKYLGLVGSWHCFISTRINFDPEIVLVKRARFILKDGTSRYYDPIPSLGHDICPPNHRA
jgi:hypothetical protein